MNKIINIDSLIIKTAFCRNLPSVDDIESTDIGHFCQSGQDTFTIRITKSTLYIVFFIEIRINSVGIQQNLFQIIHFIF